MESVLGKLISPFQAVYVRNRHIHDNVVIAHELVHSKKRMKDRCGAMGLKHDMSKTFDRVECPSRDPRQGDPLSPCLFSVWSLSPGKFFMQKPLTLFAASSSAKSPKRWSSNDSFNHLLNHFYKKVANWKGKQLIQAGSPRGTFGGEKKSPGGIYMNHWNKICTSKPSGGSGFRNLKQFNVALLSKAAWRLTDSPNELWVRILKFRNGKDIHAFTDKWIENASAPLCKHHPNPNLVVAKRLKMDGSINDKC
ncbi:uncharacterized protein LOC113296603 [Papaver somniferum]|uniref:uncharacterized protein LOC113296603 n=1 Tax=Papaver somniferum TaxID=3469 RepID=UPI000E6FBC66|nr:uncharacterized protein LOC113296603 [Papaver somniferum]